MFSVVDVVDILLKDRPEEKRYARKHKVVKGDIDIVEDGLTRKAIIESRYELRDGEEHIFVEKVKNHLTDSHIVPPAMDQHQTP